MAYSSWLLLALVGSMILTLVACHSPESESHESKSHRTQLEIRKVQSSSVYDFSASPEHLISRSDNLDECFETNGPLPHTVDLELDPSEKRSLTTYSLVTGNSGDDSILRMPRGWTLSGSNDAATWTVLDQQADSRSWKLREERFYNLSSPARYKYYRFVFTLSGPVAILRMSRLRLYAD